MTENLAVKFKMIIIKTGTSCFNTFIIINLAETAIIFQSMFYNSSNNDFGFEIMKEVTFVDLIEIHTKKNQKLKTK